MPLILAIEPDRRQAGLLAGAIRQRVGAELLLAETTEGALIAIGTRVPDLVLVPALLAPQDDAALASALRVIAAATHVRTLTIPAFANGVPHKKRTGLLARLGLGCEAEVAPDGCDPNVFADQVTAYLRETPVHRAKIEESDEFLKDDADAEAVTESSAAAPPAQEILPMTAAPIAAESVLVMTSPIAAEAIPLVAVTDYVPVAKTEPDVDEEGHTIDLSGELMSLREEEEPALEEPITAFGALKEEPVASFTVLEEESIAAFNEEPIAELAGFDEKPIKAAETPDERVELMVPLSLTQRWPALEGIASEAPSAFDDFKEDVIAQGSATREPVTISEPVVIVAVAPPPVVPAVPEPQNSDWVELVESLRLDMERLKSTSMQPPAASARREPVAASKPKRRSKHTKPIQDEWGFFDPEQCGFAALLEKLDEITKGANEPASRAQ